MLLAVDLTKPGGYFFYLGLKLKKKYQKFGEFNDPSFQNLSNMVKITQT
jgi:hypothetical protein